MICCGDNSCIFGRPIGMGTNGGCVCTESDLRMGILHLKSALNTMRQERDAAEGEAAGLRAAAMPTMPVAPPEPDPDVICRCGARIPVNS